MTPQSQTKTPRLSEPLSAALIGAGSFLFLAALSRLGPFSAADQAAWRLAQPGDAQALAQTAVRVQGPPVPSGARHERLAAQVAWLRQQGAGAIVMEAWLDEAPQTEARAFAGALRERILELSPTQLPSLKALSAAAESLDQESHLAAAFGLAQPMVLPYATLRGAELPLPDALLKQGYEVTLRGRRQALAPRRAERLPYAALLGAVARSGAVSLDEADASAVPAAVELQGRWYNGLGLEASRLAMGVPLEGLRYRWRKGRLSSLELKGVRYPLDEGGRLLIGAGVPALPTLELELLQRDAQTAAKLKGKAVFFRPWPQALSDAGAFDHQERLFAAVVERDVLLPEAEASSEALWVAAWAVALLALAWAPIWLGVALWALPLAWLLRGFAQEPQALAQPLTLALSALAIGLGWRFQVYRRRSAMAGQRFQGRVAPSVLMAWQDRMGAAGSLLDGTYAVVRPAKLASGGPFEAWLQRNEAFLDPDLGPEALGIFVPQRQPGDAWAAPALLSLQRAIPGVAVAGVPGKVSFEQMQRLGAWSWQLSGQARQEALALSEIAKKGQFLILERDYAVWHGKLKIQLTGASFPSKGEAIKVLNVLSLGV